MSVAPTVWITYASVDNEQGDFDYLRHRLQQGGVTARYDRLALMPGRRLWEQLAERTADPTLNGWAFLHHRGRPV